MSIMTRLLNILIDVVLSDMTIMINMFSICGDMDVK
jgi:hypothetical protein